MRLAGVSVGRVDSVSLSMDEEYPVVFHIALEPDITLRQDAKARLASRGILGSSFLQIHPGSPDAPVLPPGGEFYGEPKLSIEQIMTRVDDISAKVVDVLE